MNKRQIKLSCYLEQLNIEVVKVEMILNQFGIIANNQLLWLENQYPYISLHSYIVMPNHIHAVIEIDSILFNENVKIKTNPFVKKGFVATI